jgi:predicted nucleotidyltransferase
MISAVESKQAELCELCRQYRVRRLELFGSAVSSRFNTATSDLDFLVEFERTSPAESARCYFGFLFALQTLFGRDVDLVETAAIQNPYFLQSIAKDRVLLYAA